VGQLLSVAILTLATLIGVGAFLYPFLLRPAQSDMAMSSHSQDAPFVFLAAIVLCLIVIIINLETRRMNSKVVAVLGVLVAINAILRVIPGFLGFSAMFFLPILCGYVYGADFGFLLGALSLAVSAIVTNGMGPWLPYQMFAAGWMGMAASAFPNLSGRRRLEHGLLTLYGGLLGLIFGAIMDLWFWPYLFDPQQLDAYWQPGFGPWATLVHFIVFYLTTSLWWDLGRAVGNFVLIGFFGPPILRLLRRFKDRFTFEMG
jgi:energy-coupling factor transport system substrate-specific component